MKRLPSKPQRTPEQAMAGLHLADHHYGAACHCTHTPPSSRENVVRNDRVACDADGDDNDDSSDESSSSSSPPSSIMRTRLQQIPDLDPSNDYTFLSCPASAVDWNANSVKTGIWQVRPLDCYIVTAVFLRDRVDTRKLQRAIAAEHQTKVQVRLAPRDVAEALTGYRSGTMAPICHTTQLKLYLDQQVYHATGGSVLTGCGALDKILSLTSDAFRRLADNNPGGLFVGDLTRLARK